ncbi:MAG: HD domain-containing protein [Deltaproteobacteria bacterium]|nr:MAG: HD domain-containing protein [Deltaproteobacteria bacterium]
MERVRIDQIKEKDLIESVFLVKSKNLAVAKSGKPYLNLVLMDRSGEIEAKVWDEAEEASRLFDQNDFIKLRGKVTSYQGQLQIVISQVKRYDEEKVEIKEFQPATERDTEVMFQELMEMVDQVKDQHLKRLLNLIFEEERVAKLFKIAPAAKSMHHVYLGGLLEHTLSVARLILLVSRHYQNINQDLLLAGGILHDIGKVYELTYDRAFDYSDRGKLIGHIIIGAELIEEKIRNIPDFPTELAMLLKHMILSHHGEYEYGSPKRPKTVEAIILHYLEDMDSKVSSVQSLIKKEGETKSKWTSYHRLYDRYIYKGETNND